MLSAARARSNVSTLPSSSTTSSAILSPSILPVLISNWCSSFGPAVPVILPPSCLRFRNAVSALVSPSGPVTSKLPDHLPVTSASRLTTESRRQHTVLFMHIDTRRGWAAFHLSRTPQPLLSPNNAPPGACPSCQDPPQSSHPRHWRTSCLR